MKKRFLSIMLVLVLSLFFVGCGNYADMYSLNKDVTIKENTETVELENIKNDLIESMKDVKVISAEISFKMDTGEIQIIGKKQRIVVDLSMELVMDSTDEANPKMSVIAKGYSENYENGAKMETMEAEASQYLKEGYLYNYNYEKDTKMVDGKAETERRVDFPADSLSCAGRSTDGRPFSGGGSSHSHVFHSCFLLDLSAYRQPSLGHSRFFLQRSCHQLCLYGTLSGF